MPSGQPETHEDFEAAAKTIWDGLPEQFRAVLGNVTVYVADFAARDCRSKANRLLQVCPTGSFSTVSQSSVTPTRTARHWTALSATC